jgi:uncharacterized membrane protein
VLLFNLLVILYLGGAFLAPTLMRLNLEPAARVLYGFYRPVCHQFGYRSFFLFGEQPFYPRELAGLEAYQSFSQATGISEMDPRAASEFSGNAALGYKIALCQRDTAIYLFILIFGLIFGVSGRKIKELRWYVWLLLGILPIALDGGTQMVSQMGLSFLSWFPVRESTPYLRVLTGALFGFFTAWLGYPWLRAACKPAECSLRKSTRLRMGRIPAREAPMIRFDMDGCRYYRFENLPADQVDHAVFTRLGGCSVGAYSALNLGGTVGDNPEAVVENHQRLFEVFGRPYESRFDVWQVHGTTLVYSDRPRPRDHKHQPADGIFTDNPELTLIMRFADCVPLVFYDPYSVWLAWCTRVGREPCRISADWLWIHAPALWL